MLHFSGVKTEGEEVKFLKVMASQVWFQRFNE